VPASRAGPRAGLRCRSLNLRKTCATFYPLMFFAGLYYPAQLLPGVLQDTSHFLAKRFLRWE
jgi:hypothetical protein